MGPIPAGWAGQPEGGQRTTNYDALNSSPGGRVGRRRLTLFLAEPPAGHRVRRTEARFRYGERDVCPRPAFREAGLDEPDLAASPDVPRPRFWRRWSCLDAAARGIHPRRPGTWRRELPLDGTSCRHLCGGYADISAEGAMHACTPTSLSLTGWTCAGRPSATALASAQSAPTGWTALAHPELERWRSLSGSAEAGCT